MVNKNTKNPKSISTSDNKEIFNLILENTLNLQKNILETGEELKMLNVKLTQLLDIFDKAYKTFEESLQNGNSSDLTDIEKKLELLTEQNKIIAKGILLLEKTTRNLPIGQTSITNISTPISPQKMQRSIIENSEENNQGYSY